jgi:pheromone shutdown protein TraB
MITILGTSHISKRSSKEVREAIATADIVAIELDGARAAGLMTNKRATFKELHQALGLKTALMAMIMRSLQEKIAKNVGVLPGIEMRTALKEANEQQKLIALIDRDIRVTLKRLSSSFGWPEIKQMAKDSFRKREIPIHPSDDLVVELLEEMKRYYPRIYKAMVAERDLYMAKALIHVQLEHPDKHIVAIVGKGHVQGMVHQINYLNSQMPVRLWSSQATS